MAASCSARSPWLCTSGSTRLGFLVFADAAAPGALLARGIARIGCHVSGDGDYGVSTSLPWGTDYSHGIYPPSQALSRLPMHPTGIYEFLISALLFAMLWRYRARIRPQGRMFMLYLFVTGAVRFGLEFVALAPAAAIGLTEAQWISLGLVAIGVIGVARYREGAAPMEPGARRLGPARAPAVRCRIG